MSDTIKGRLRLEMKEIGDFTTKAKMTPFFPGGRIIHRGFQDPSVVRGTEEEKLAAFRKSRDEIGDWLKMYFTSQ